MNKLSKKKKTVLGMFSNEFSNTKGEAIRIFDFLKKTSSKKFIESVDISINLGIDSKRSDQMIRGTSLLPKGTGKLIKVAVFAEGDNVKKAVEAGADIVGSDDLFSKIKENNIDFDILISSPEFMPTIAKLGQILGPRGLMPNPKDGTVTTDIASTIKNIKLGQVNFRSDKSGIIHCSIGNTNFDSNDLLNNLESLIIDIKKLKPAASKGIFIKKITISSTMGFGIEVDQSSLKI